MKRFVVRTIDISSSRNDFNTNMIVYFHGIGRCVVSCDKLKSAAKVDGRLHIARAVWMFI